MTPVAGSARNVLSGSVLYAEPLMSGYHPVRSLPLKMGTHPSELAPSPPRPPSVTGLTIASVIVEAVPAPPPAPVVAIMELPALLPEPLDPFDPPAPGVVESPAEPGDPADAAGSVAWGSLAPQLAAANPANTRLTIVVVFMMLASFSMVEFRVLM